MQYGKRKCTTNNSSMLLPKIGLVWSCHLYAIAVNVGYSRMPFTSSVSRPSPALHPANMPVHIPDYKFASWGHGGVGASVSLLHTHQNQVVVVFMMGSHRQEHLGLKQGLQHSPSQLALSFYICIQSLRLKYSSNQQLSQLAFMQSCLGGACLFKVSTHYQLLV